jgi:hypothetical protein
METYFPIINCSYNYEILPVSVGDRCFNSYLGLNKDCAKISLFTVARNSTFYGGLTLGFLMRVIGSSLMIPFSINIT